MNSYSDLICRLCLSYYMEVRCVHIPSLVFNSQRPASYTNTEINHLSFQLINAPELSHDLEEAQT